MGCGCGGRKNVVRQGQTAPTPVNQVAARQVQPVQRQAARQAQPNTAQAQATRQALVQKTRERLQQNQMGAREDIEKRRRIQVSLRNRNNRPSA